MKYFPKISLLIIILIISIKFSSTKQYKSYEINDEVILYVNKVGPYYNPHETYHYYTLPVCRPTEISFKSLNLGEVLDGDRMAKSIYRINFRKNVENMILCRLVLTPSDVRRFIRSIEDLYYFEFVLDNVPFRGFIGNLEESKLLPHTHKTMLYTHHDIRVEFNGKFIIYPSIFTTQSDPIDLSGLIDRKSINITFTYSVRWIATKTEIGDRLERLMKTNFFPVTLEIHWISITNSLVLVFLLVTFIMFIISRVLRRDFARYNRLNAGIEFGGGGDPEDTEQDDRGWKIVHNDVFRPPRNPLVFCGVIGTGCQLVSIAAGIMVMAVGDMFNVHNHGVINIAALVLYSLTSWVGGFVACRLYRVLANTQPISSPPRSTTDWVRVVNATSAMFGVPLVLVWLVCNTVSVLYGTTHAMPIATILTLLLVWLVVGYPLTVTGGMLGKRTDDRVDSNGCRARNIAREIPDVVWYKSRGVYLCLGGFLPFSSICIELYYIFSTIWGRDHYNLYGVLFIIFFILILVTVCVSINITYFQLVNEDYRWWWNTLLLAASSSGFVFVYCLFHYFYRSKMSGFVQTIEYFSYSILICYAFFLALGAVSFISSFCFIKFMYRNIKLD